MTRDCVFGKHVVCEGCSCICHSDPELVEYFRERGRVKNVSRPRWFDAPAPRPRISTAMLNWLAWLKGRSA